MSLLSKAEDIAFFFALKLQCNNSSEDSIKLAEYALTKLVRFTIFFTLFDEDLKHIVKYYQVINLLLIPHIVIQTLCKAIAQPYYDNIYPAMCLLADV